MTTTNDTLQRASLDYVLTRTAHLFATRATCDRKGVGCVLAIDGRIISTGYNGPISGQKHCTHIQDGDDKPCYRSVHAESNAIAYAARLGVPTYGATAYCTLSPCMACAMLLINAGIERVVYNNQYRDGAGIDLLNDSGVEVCHYEPEKASATPGIPTRTHLSSRSNDLLDLYQGCQTPQCKSGPHCSQI